MIVAVYLQLLLPLDKNWLQNRLRTYEKSKCFVDLGNYIVLLSPTIFYPPFPQKNNKHLYVLHQAVFQGCWSDPLKGTEVQKLTMNEIESSVEAFGVRHHDMWGLMCWSLWAVHQNMVCRICDILLHETVASERIVFIMFTIVYCIHYILVIKSNLHIRERWHTMNIKGLQLGFILSIGKNRILALELYQAKALHVKLEYPWRQSQLRVNDKKECMENIQCEEVLLEISRELILSLGGGGLSIPTWSGAPASGIWYRIHSSLHEAG